MKTIAAAVALTALLALSGCGTTTGSRTGTGALGGAAAGAAIGSLSGDAGKGALIGAGLGAAGGYLYDRDQKQRERRDYGYSY
jgi:hypothetical protein